MPEITNLCQIPNVLSASTLPCASSDSARPSLIRRPRERGESGSESANWLHNPLVGQVFFNGFSTVFQRKSNRFARPIGSRRFRLSSLGGLLPARAPRKGIYWFT